MNRLQVRVSQHREDWILKSKEKGFGTSFLRKTHGWRSPLPTNLGGGIPCYTDSELLNFCPKKVREGAEPTMKVQNTKLEPPRQGEQWAPYILMPKLLEEALSQNLYHAHIISFNHEPWTIPIARINSCHLLSIPSRSVALLIQSLQ